VFEIEQTFDYFFAGGKSHSNCSISILASSSLK